MAIPLVIAAGLFLAAFALLMRRVAEPVGEIVAAADRISSRNFSVRVPECGPESVRTVARAFNTMAARLESQDQARRDLMGDIAHELRTPLAVLQGRIEGLIDGVYPRDEARLGELLEDTRVLARPEAERLLREFDDEVAARGLYANPFDRAGALAALGRRDEAFRELEKAYRDRFIAITWLKVAPTLDPLRNDARYSDLLRRMRLD